MLRTLFSQTQSSRRLFLIPGPQDARHTSQASLMTRTEQSLSAASTLDDQCDLGPDGADGGSWGQVTPRSPTFNGFVTH